MGIDSFSLLDSDGGLKLPGLNVSVRARSADPWLAQDTSPAVAWDPLDILAPIRFRKW